ncbi:MAG: hypothetical protein ABS79_00455 [Planctomycetes bacterium SCN 63-9]|nr:MAG: hypothetical protein ABS79_00455 [Planctomycetes bacterium SCN 63-9]
MSRVLVAPATIRNDCGFGWLEIDTEKAARPFASPDVLLRVGGYAPAGVLSSLSRMRWDVGIACDADLDITERQRW